MVGESAGMASNGSPTFDTLDIKEPRLPIDFRRGGAALSTLVVVVSATTLTLLIIAFMSVGDTRF